MGYCFPTLRRPSWRQRAWAHAERRVRALLLKGSLGRGEGDARSDVDVVIVTEPGQLASLWGERRATAERLGRPLGLFRDIAMWRPPHLAIALYDGPLKVDLWFEEGEVEPSEWLRSGFRGHPRQCRCRGSPASTPRESVPAAARPAA